MYRLFLGYFKMMSNKPGLLFRTRASKQVPSYVIFRPQSSNRNYGDQPAPAHRLLYILQGPMLTHEQTHMCIDVCIYVYTYIDMYIYIYNCNVYIYI